MKVVVAIAYIATVNYKCAEEVPKEIVFKTASLHTSFSTGVSYELDSPKLTVFSDAASIFHRNDLEQLRTTDFAYAPNGTKEQTRLRMKNTADFQ